MSKGAVTPLDGKRERKLVKRLRLGEQGVGLEGWQKLGHFLTGNLNRRAVF